MDVERLLSIGGSLLVHLILVGILAFTMWSETDETPVAVTQKPIIQARAVDEATAMEPVRRREAEEKSKKEEAERKRKAVEAEKKRQAEEKRKKIEAEKKRQAELKRKKEAEAKRQAEQKKKQEEEQKRLAEEKRKQEAETKRLAEEKRQQEEAERKRKEEEDLERRKAELQRQMEEEAERLAEEARQQRASALSKYVDEYKAAIIDKVQRNWRRPTGTSKDFICKVEVNQLPGGDVSSVRVIDTCGSSVLDRSVEAAVRKASPLPKPPVADVFDRELVITFVPR